MTGRVLSVSLSPVHAFSKSACKTIELIKGKGVVGDAHFGATVKHRSRVAKDPTQPNLRQVHLIHAELFDELALKGFDVAAGLLGENVTTLGVPLLALSCGTKLHIGESAIVELSGLRNPCGQLNNYQNGLMNALLDKDLEGKLIRKSGVMSIVTKSGPVSVGDSIIVEPPNGAFIPMDRV